MDYKLFLQHDGNNSLTSIKIMKENSFDEQKSFIIKEGNLIDNKKEGVWYIYSNKNKEKILLGTEEYENGEKINVTIYYLHESTDNITNSEYNKDKTFKDRKINFTGTFKNGKPHGLWKKFSNDICYREGNELINNSKYSLEYEGFFENGIPSGEWIFPTILYENKQYILDENEIIENKTRTFYRIHKFIDGEMIKEVKIVYCDGENYNKEKAYIVSLEKEIETVTIQRMDYGICNYNFFITKSSKLFEYKEVEIITDYFNKEKRSATTIKISASDRYHLKKYYKTKKNGIESGGIINCFSFNGNEIEEGEWLYYNEEGKVVEKRNYSIINLNHQKFKENHHFLRRILEIFQEKFITEKLLEDIKIGIYFNDKGHFHISKTNEKTSKIIEEFYELIKEVSLEISGNK